MNQLLNRPWKRYGSRAADSLLPRIIDFAEREGILPMIRRYSPLSREEIFGLLEKDLGYVVEEGNRGRMIGALLDLLFEAGVLREEGGCGIALAAVSEKEQDALCLQLYERDDPVGPDGEVDFFHRCLDHAPFYLRGFAPAISFRAAHQSLWDLFLGSETFRYFRNLVLELLVSRETSGFRLLDLGHGPGWGSAAAIRIFPGMRITAIDYTDSFSRIARERVGTQLSENERSGLPLTEITWVGPDRWKGFGDPLPFDDGNFDGVLFSGGDPYIPRDRRAGVYRDIYRVLAPEGRLGILTRGYPDRNRVHVPSTQMRLAALVHDFAESVCEGWEGFSGVEESISMFREIGFAASVPLMDRMNAFESSIWVLKKRGIDA